MRTRGKRNLVLGALAAFAGYVLFVRPKVAQASAVAALGPYAKANPDGTISVMPGAFQTQGAQSNNPAVNPAVNLSTEAAKNLAIATARDQAFPANTDVGRTIAGAGPLGTPVPLSTNIPVSSEVKLRFGDSLRIKTPNTSAKDSHGTERLTKFTIVKYTADHGDDGLEGRAVAYEFPDGTFVGAPTNTPFVHFDRKTVSGFAYGYVNGAPSVGGGGTGN